MNFFFLTQWIKSQKYRTLAKKMYPLFANGFYCTDYFSEFQSLRPIFDLRHKPASTCFYSQSDLFYQHVEQLYSQNCRHLLCKLRVISCKNN